MTIIQIWCPGCGTENTVPSGALLSTVGAEDLDPHYAGAVAWICAGCVHLIAAPVTWNAFLTLLSNGVTMLERDGDFDQETHLPPHPEQPRAGQPFTPDDLLELHERLSEDTWFTALATTSRAAP
jgi:hypothetical protein